MHARSAPALIPEDGGSLLAGACDLPEVAPGAGPRRCRPGDVVWFPPGEKHWHGATPKTAMTHIAVQERWAAVPSRGWSTSATSSTRVMGEQDGGD